MSTSQTAVVPNRSFSMRELRIFRSCSGSALPAGTGAPAAAVFGAEGFPEFFDIVYSTPPTATAAITTNTPTTILLEPACFCSCAASNIFPPSPASCAFAHRIPRLFRKARQGVLCAELQNFSHERRGFFGIGMKGRKSLAYPYSASRKAPQALACRAIPQGLQEKYQESPYTAAAAPRPLRLTGAS